MLLVDINMIKGSRGRDKNLALMEGVTDVIARVLGEPMRQHTWVRIVETESDQWMIAREIFTLDHVKRLQAGEL